MIESILKRNKAYRVCLDNKTWGRSDGCVNVFCDHNIDDNPMCCFGKSCVDYIEGKTRKQLELEYITKDDVRSLAECPTVGGIDLGDPRFTDEGEIDGDDPTENEIAERASRIRSQSLVKGKQATTGKWQNGDTAWAYDKHNPMEPPYFCRLVCDPWKTATGQIVNVEAEDGEWEVPLHHLSVERPNAK